MLVENPRIRLVVGLGNPGSEYAGTRHNAGFDVVGRMLGKLPGEFTESHVCSSRCFSGRFRGRDLYLQLPLTYMNLSGTAVAPLARKREIAPEEILVIYDDLDLPVGRLRIRSGGSAGGHHGVESVIEELKDAGFVRLRVGIGSQRKGRTIDHVLSTVDADERPVYDESLEAAARAAVAILAGGAGRAMNEFNAWRPEAELQEEKNKAASGEGAQTKEVLS